MKMTRVSLISICAFFIFFVSLNIIIITNYNKEARIHQVAILLCKRDRPIANSCESITLHNMKYKYDNQKYWQEAEKIFEDEVKIKELQIKVVKIEKFNNEVVKVEKKRLEQEQKEKILAQIKDEFKVKKGMENE